MPNNLLAKIKTLIVGESIRVTVKNARALLLNNPTITIGDNSFCLVITPLGLGVCSVELRAGVGVVMAKKVIDRKL
jgi:hypothetical protein